VAPPSLIDRTEMAPEAAPPDFSWPDFDRWQAAFAAAEAFPPRWEGLHVAPPPHTPEAEAYQQRKLVLYSEWQDMLARRSTVLAHYARQGISARVARQDTSAPCPACDPFDARAVGLGDAMPPFHPGCRCVLVAMHPPPARPRSRPYERPRPRPG
jgi:hypothetical protein